jgi:hypothetical protein
MSTVRQVITRALRLAKQLAGAGARTPPPEDAEDALEAARGMYAGFIANGLFGPITDVLEDEAYTAGENERITKSGVFAVTLPTTIEDDSSGTTVTRAPEDRAFVLISGSTPEAHVYDADKADWLSIYDLTLDSYAPFSTRYATHLAALLAVHVMEEYGSAPGPILLDMAQTAKAALRQKKPRRATADPALLRGLAHYRYC